MAWTIDEVEQLKVPRFLASSLFPPEQLLWTVTIEPPDAHCRGIFRQNRRGPAQTPRT